MLILFIFTFGAAVKGGWELSVNLNPELTSGYIINLFWAAYNLVILYYTILVGYERPRKRQTERFTKKLPVKMVYENEANSILVAATMDVSETGCSITVPTFDTVQRNVTLMLTGEQEHQLRAEVVRVESGEKGCQAHFKFEDMALKDMQKWMNEVYSIRS